MSSEGGHKVTVTVLGATGGCGLAFLIRALQAGHNCNACECFFFKKKNDSLSSQRKRKKKTLRYVLSVVHFLSLPPQR